MKLPQALGSLLLTGLLSSAPPAGAADPAVSGVNGFVEGGYTNFWQDGPDSARWLVQGATFFPLGRKYGASLNVVGGQEEQGPNETFRLLGGGGSLFWRNPKAGYLGMSYEYDDVESFGDHRYALLLGMFSENLDFNIDAAFRFGDRPTRFFLGGTLGWYATNDLRPFVDIDYRHTSATSIIDSINAVAGSMGFSWHPPIGALSHVAFSVSGVIGREFASGGEIDFVGIDAGVTVYLPTKKRLKQRLREDVLQRPRSPIPSATDVEG